MLQFIMKENFYAQQFSHYPHQLMEQFSSFDIRNYSVPHERASFVVYNMY